ncbi:hypothetical protein Adt_21051 [Abeliophyllum distichum]|uniref:Uncharacterized protein n=1 Tax=Abeliophyllum distichum TaxID=126358 RepID=A0ABD1SYD7_9LAMI
MIKRGSKISGINLSLGGQLNLANGEVIDQVMLIVIGSSLDALERGKVKEKKKKKSKTCLVDPLVSFHDLPSQTELPNTASPVAQKHNRPVLRLLRSLTHDLQCIILQKDGAIRQMRLVRSLQDANTSLRGENEILKLGKNDAELAAKREMDKLVEMVSRKLSLEQELPGFKESKGLGFLL